MVKVDKNAKAPAGSDTDEPLSEKYLAIGREVLGPRATRWPPSMVKREIIKLQGMLAARGMYDGDLEGKWGTKSTAGLKKFITQYGLPEGMDAKTAQTITKVNYLRFLDAHDFAVPATVKVSPLDQFGLTDDEKSVDAAIHLKPVLHVKTGSSDDKTFAATPTVTLMHQLHYEGDGAFREAAGDHLDDVGGDSKNPNATNRTLSEDVALRQVRMALELERRLASAPICSFNEQNPEQAAIGAQVTESLFYAARWYANKAQETNDPALKADATKLFQRCLESAREYVREPANMGGSTGVEKYAVRVAYDLRRIPDEYFNQLKVGDQTVADVAKANPATIDPKSEIDAAAQQRDATVAALLSGASSARDLPTKADIAAGMFPNKGGNAEVKAVRALAVSAAYDLQRYEHFASVDKAMQKMFPKAKTDEQLYQARFSTQGTRGYLLQNFDRLVAIESKMSKGIALSEDETGILKMIRKDLPAQLRQLQATPQKKPQGYVAVSDYFSTDTTHHLPEIVDYELAAFLKR